MPDQLILAFNFLISTIFDLFLFVLVIRLILAWVNANYFHPFTQFIANCSNWLIKPTRKIIPNIGRLETASLLWIVILDIAKLLLLNLIISIMPNILGILIYACGDILKIFIQTFIFAILFQFALSWLQPFSPAHQLLQQIVAPILRPFQRIIPRIGGIDISPIPALLVLQLLLMLVTQPLMLYGGALAY